MAWLFTWRRTVPPAEAARPEESHRPSWHLLAAAALLGGLMSLSFAPQEWPWMQLLALGGLFGLLRGATPKQAAWRACAFQLGCFASSWWWLHISLHQFGGLASGLAVIAVALLALGMSLYLVAAAALWARWQTGRPGLDALGFAGAWLLAEWLRATLFGGFPWSSAGYAHTTGPLAALAPWIGVYGIGFMAAWLSALALNLLVARQPRAWPLADRALLLAAVGLAGAAQLVPAAFTQPTGVLSVSLIQPAIPQDLKFDPARIQSNLQQLVGEVTQAPGQFVLTPETVIPVRAEEIAPEVFQQLSTRFDGQDRLALMGMFIRNQAGEDTNGLVAFGGPGMSLAREPWQDSARYRYGKRHLLPFGEVIPPGFQWFMDLLSIPNASQGQGDTTRPVSLGAQRIRPLICYEDLFGEDFAEVTLPSGGGATMFADATNLAWFGTEPIQSQHLQFSRMRALEFQRPFVRATNTGATTVIDHQGRVTASLPPNQPGVLNGTVEGREGVTPYALWLSRCGTWPLALLAVAAMVFTRSRREA